MPIMSRMRDSMPVILFTLLIVFVLTIIFDWGMGYLGLSTGNREELGSVNGHVISYREFSDVLRSYTESQKAQTGQEPTEQLLKEARDQIWQSMVTQRLMMDEAARLGVSVTNQELVDWVRGDNPPDDLRRNFIDSTGQFRRDIYDQFLSNPNQFLRDPEGNDPNYGTKWLTQYEESLRQRRLQEKLQSLILATVNVGDGEVRQRFAEQNQRFNALYAFADAGVLVKDEEVQLADADFRAYFDENVEQYKVPASRSVSFVVFPEAPTAADTAARMAEMDELAQKARGGADFIDLASMYTERRDTGTYYRHGELSPSVETAVFAARKGDLVGPIQDENGLHLVKVLDERRGGTEYLRASHILFRLEGEPDSNAVKALAQKVAGEARAGKNFAQLATAYSKDPGSAMRGGDLGWFTKGRMVPEFEKAAFGARVGDVVGPVRSPFGLHVIKVTGRDARELNLVTVNLKIDASPQTRNDLIERSRDFAYNVRETDMTTEAKQLGLEVKQADLQEKGGMVPGIGVDESITRWAFANSVGTVSEPFTVPGGYAVFAVTGAAEAGVKPFDDVKESLRPLVLRKKKLERAKAIAAQLRSQLTPGDSLTKVRSLTPSLPVTETGQFTLASAIPTVGREPNFAGAVAGLQIGQISPAVEGSRGAYLIQLLSKTEVDTSMFASQREVLRTRLLQEKRSRYIAEWVEELRKKADIEDKRDLFFR